MNKIFRIVRNKHGKVIVANEFAKSASGLANTTRMARKLTSIALGSVMATGGVSSVIAQTTNNNEGGLIGGIASGSNSVAIGDSSWGTSENGVASGAGSIATGGNIDREQFNTFLQNLSELTNQQSELKNEKNSAIAGVENAKNRAKLEAEKIAQLQAQIESLQNKVNGTDVGNLSSQRDENQNALNSLTSDNGNYTVALNNLNNIRSETGINLFADFSGMINYLNWGAVQGKSEQEQIDTLGQELFEKVNTVNPNIIIGEGTPQNPQYGLNDFKEIISGVLNINGSYQSLYNELQNKDTISKSGTVNYSSRNMSSNTIRYNFSLPSSYINHTLFASLTSTKNAKDFVPTAAAKDLDSHFILSMYKPNLTDDYHQVLRENILKAGWGDEIDGYYTIARTNDNYLVAINGNGGTNYGDNLVNIKNGGIKLYNYGNNTLEGFKSQFGEVALAENTKKINTFLTKSINSNIVLSHFLENKAKVFISGNSSTTEIIFSDKIQYTGNNNSGQKSAVSTYMFQKQNGQNKYVSNYSITNLLKSPQTLTTNLDNFSLKSDVQAQYTLRALISNTGLRPNLSVNTYDDFVKYKGYLETIKAEAYIPDFLDANFYNTYIDRRIDLFNDLVKEPKDGQLGGMLYYFNQNAINSTTEYSEELQLARDAFVQKWGAVAGYVSPETGVVSEDIFNKHLEDTSVEGAAAFFDDMYSGNGGPGKRVYGGLVLSESGIQLWNEAVAETAEFRKKLKDGLITYDPTLDVIKDIVNNGEAIQKEYDKQKAEKERLEKLIDDLTKQIDQAGKDGQDLNSLKEQLENQKQLKQQADNALADAEGQLNDINGRLAEISNKIVKAIAEQKGIESVASGARSFASGNYALAIGSDSTAIGDNAIAIGKNASAKAANAVAIGKGSVATSEKSIAIGSENNVTGIASVAVGSSNVINGANSVAMGQGNQITGEKSVAVGFGHVIKGNSSGAFGDPNIIEANNAYAIGNNNKIFADQGLTMGNNNTIGTQPVEGDGVAPEERGGYASTAIGNNIRVQGKNAVVIGNQTSSTNDYNVVLGYGSSDSYTPPTDTSSTTGDLTENTSSSTASYPPPKAGGSIVSVGNASEGLFRKIVNVAEGAISSTSKEAINGSQLNELNTKITNLLNLKSDIDKAIEDLKNNVQNLNITDPAITVTQRSGEATPDDKTDDVYQGSVLGALSDEQREAGVNSLVLTDLANGNISADSKDAITGAQLNTTANDIAKHLGGGATNNGGSITAPSYTVTDVDGKTDKSYNNVGDAVDALNKLAKSGANTEKAFESVAQNLGGGATYDKENKVVTKPTYNVADIANDKVQAHDNVGSAIEALDNNDKALATAVTYNANNIALLGQSVSAMGQNLNGLNQAVGQLSNQVSRNTESIQRMQNDIANNRKEARAGTAAAMAMATLPQPWRPSQTSVAMGAATYRGEHGAAIGVSRLSDNGKFMIKSAINVNTKSGFGAAVGAAWYFD